MRMEDFVSDLIGNPWPNSDFEFVRTHTGNIDLGVRCHGSPLRIDYLIGPEMRLAGLEYDLKQGIVDTDFETFLRSLISENQS